MFLQIENEWVRLIGDPHMGKEFKTGVPLHRRGEREEGQKLELRRQLNDVVAPDGKIVKAVILVGDLFDSFRVSQEVLLSTFEEVEAAALSHLITGVQFLILMGNHDVTRNVNLVSSFDLLEHMALPENVVLVKSITAFAYTGVSKPVLLCPYDAFKTTKELFEGISGQYSLAVGHWDTVSFGGEDHNLIPLEYLAPLCDTIVTGHEHNPRSYTYGQTPVHVIGSMLPYSFSEDVNETIYVTRTLSEYLEDPQAYSDKCLRLVIKKGEEVPADIDALQLVIKFVTEDTEKEETEVVIDDFSMQGLFTEVMNEHGVSEETQKKYWGVYQDALSA